MNSISPVAMIAAGSAARMQATRFAAVHSRSRQVAGSVASHLSRPVKVSASSGRGAYRSAMGTPHQSPASCLVRRASPRMPSSAGGTANRARPSPVPSTTRASSTRWSWGPRLPTMRTPAPSAVRNTAPTITISSPSPASISPVNATPRVAATSPACGPNRGLVRRGEVITAIGRLLTSLPVCRAGAARSVWLGPEPRVYLGLPTSCQRRPGRRHRPGGPGCARVTGIRTGMVENMALAQQGLVEDEGVRSARLLDAQDRAAELFAAIEPRGIIAPGVRETEASDAIRDLAAEMFGVSRHWHKRIVRAGPNTLQPYKQNPPDREITADDIVFLDFGPIFEEWEADFGRTYVLGDDPVKLRLRDALPVMFRAGRRYFEAHEDVTGEQLYAYMTGLAEADGWTFGGTIAGHLVGQFPHEKIAGDDIESYIAPGSDKPMRRTDSNGQVCHWILEVHLVDLDRQIGGFFEELLDLGPGPS